MGKFSKLYLQFLFFLKDEKQTKLFVYELHLLG